MDKLTSIIEKYLMPVSEKLGNNKYLQAMQQGIMASMPLIIIGSLFTLIANLPYQPYIDFMKRIRVYGYLNSVGEATTDLMALFTVFFTAYYFGKNEDIDPAPAGMIALASFFLLTPHYINAFNAKAAATSMKAISYDYMGSTSLFLALIVGLLVGKLYVVMIKKGWTIKMPEGVPPTISRSFTPIIATAVITSIFVVVAAVFTNTSYGNIHVFISSVVQKPMMKIGQNVWFFILLYTLMNIIWFFGIHGSAIYYTVSPIITAINMANLTAFQAGQPLPSMYASWAMFFMAGGLGNTLGLVVYMAFKAKSARYKQLAKMTLIPGLCNINEPLVFGMPMVMNPLMFFPMVLNPLVVGLIAYFGFKTGLVHYSTAIAVPWTTPRVVMALLYGGVSLMVLQLITTIVSGIMYVPFFKTLDKQEYEEEQRLASKNA